MRKITFPFLIAALIGLDQLVKWWTVTNIALNTSQKWISGFMSLAYLRNYGAAYSLLQNQQWLFIIITIFVLTLAIWYFVKQIDGNLWQLFALSLIIAGGLGNFIDRLRLGYVVDMFKTEFIDFPVFNVADSCLTVGVALLFICILREDEHGSKN